MPFGTNDEVISTSPTTPRPFGQNDEVLSRGDAVPFQKRTGQDEAAHGTLSEWKPSIGERLSMAAPGLFSGEIQPATGMPRGALPRIGQAASSFLHFAPLSAEQWIGQPPQNVAQGVTEGVAKQITPANIGIGLAAAPLFMAKEATVPITLAKSIIAAYFAKQGAETMGTEAERMTRPQAIDPTLTPGQRAEAGANVALGGLVRLAPAFPHPPTAKFFTPEDVQRYSVNPEGFEKRQAQEPPVVLGGQPPPKEAFLVGPQGEDLSGRVQYIPRPIQPAYQPAGEPLQGGQVSFGGTPIPNARQQGFPLNRQEESLVQEALSGEVTGPSGPYLRPGLPPTQEQLAKRQAKESVEQGLTMEELPGYDLPKQETPLTPTEADEVVLSNLQKDRLRAAVARGADADTIRGILRLKEEEPTLVKVTELNSIKKPGGQYAIQERETTSVPMGPPPGDSGQVESRVRGEGVQQPEVGETSQETTQGDVGRYNQLVGQMKTNPTPEAWQELETLKNKYGGMPPTERQVIESGEEKGQTQEQERVLNQPEVPPSGTIGGGIQRAVEGGRRGEEGAVNLQVVRDAINAVYDKVGEGVEAVKDLFGDKPFRTAMMRMSGVAAPNTTRRMPIVGNQLVMTAKANDIVELVKKDLVNQVLGSRYKDPEFDKLVGAVGVEDNLRAKGAKNVASGLPSGVTSVVGQPWSPIKTEAQYQQLKNATAIKEALERHKQLIQPEVEQRHVALGGKLRQGGLETDAFFNLIPVQQATKSGATSGQLATLKKGSMFGRQFKGTAPEYDLSYRNMAERMVAGNWFEMEKQRLFNLAESTGFGKVQRSGAPIPTFDKPMEPIPIQRKQIVYQKQGGPGKTVVKNETLWVPKDTAEEFRQAFQTDSPLAKALRIPGRLLTEAQISLGADALIHISNMTAGIVTAPEKVTAVKYTLQNIKRVWDNDASVQHDLATLAKEYGIVRGEQAGDRSLWRKVLQPGSGAIRFYDKVARLTLNQLYEDAVQRGESPDSKIWRRAAVHGAIGEYNVRLLTKLQQQLKEVGVSPFIVAGKTFNRLSVRQLTMAPGRKAVDVQAGAQMRAKQALYAGALLIAAPMVINSITTGTPFGRPGVDVGDIDTGKSTKNGKPITVDVAKMLMVRRGLRITGVQAIARGIEQGQSVKQIAKGAATDIARGVAQPYAGPLVSAEEMVRTGKDFMQYRRAQDQSLGGKLKEAVKEANPMTATLLGKPSEGDLGERTLSRLGRVAGVMTGPSPVSTIKSLAVQFN